MKQDLKGKIALITGGSRGAGRGIAIELAQAGCKVYITGRSRRGNSTTQYDDLTLDDTKDIIKNDGGECVILECDHANENEIRSIFKIIKKNEGKLDILVNNVWAGYTDDTFKLDGMDSFIDNFWEQPIWRWDHMFQISLRSHFICSQEAAKLMISKRSGLIIITGFWDDDKYFAPVPYNIVKQAKARMAYGMGIELLDHNVASVYLSMGWIRTEHLKNIAKDISLDDFNYSNFEEYKPTESTRYLGRAIVALANDPKLMDKTGKTLITGELAKEYGFTDLDGTQPERFVLPDFSKGLTTR